MTNRKSAGLKSNGRLKKGYRFAKGGRVVKAACATKNTRKRCSARPAKRRR